MAVRSAGRVQGADRAAVNGAARLGTPAEPPVIPLLEELQDRVQWLAIRMIHEANVVRPSRDGVKVGGHQASSASVITILTELYFRWLRRGDLIAVKPHASPAFHAIQYLMGNLDRSYLTRLREFGGLQSYPSRTKDPDPVDFSTGSVGLGAVAPLFASLADRYLNHHFAEQVAKWPDRRFVALVGDAELDEGSSHEAIAVAPRMGLDALTVIAIDNQSSTLMWPGGIARRFEIEGWSAATVDGRDHAAIEDALTAPQTGEAHPHRPRAVVAVVEKKQ